MQLQSELMSQRNKGMSDDKDDNHHNNDDNAVHVDKHHSNSVHGNK
jgi:hypothetical protein